MNDYKYKNSLNPQKALIWRIVHVDNIAWILQHGLHCGNSQMQCKHWIHIGNTELIDKRAKHPVTIGQGGCLNDYVPFYFTPFSPMLLNIITGRGVQQRQREDIIVLVSSLFHLQALGIPFIFTDSHAYYRWSKYYDDLSDLDQIDWKILQNRDFSRDPDDPAKIERYQAEVLIHQHCPTEALFGIMCYDEATKIRLDKQLQQADLDIKVRVNRGVYFQ